MSIFSPEKQDRCGLPDTPEIPQLPEIADCNVGDIPELPLKPEIFPPDGNDGCDGLDGQDGNDGRDGCDGAEGCDGLDGQDGNDGRDGCDGAEGCDGLDGQDGNDGSDGVDGTDGCDGLDGQDGNDGRDGCDGAEGCDGLDGQDGNDGRDGCDGQEGCDGLDGQDGNDGVDGVDGTDGCDGIDGQDGNDGRDGCDGQDGCDGIDGQDGNDGRDGCDGQEGCDGIDGQDGNDGRDGCDGQDGCDGIDGQDGNDGRDGCDGQDGCDGIDGQDGNDGRDGCDGQEGCDGIDGQDGNDGRDGVDGDAGCDGLDGQDGNDGADGADGAAGCDGIDGQDGNDGRDGCDGADGEAGKDGCDGIDGRDGIDGQDGKDGMNGAPGPPALLVSPLEKTRKCDDGGEYLEAYLCKVKEIKNYGGQWVTTVKKKLDWMGVSTDEDETLLVYNFCKNELDPKEDYVAVQDRKGKWIIPTGGGSKGPDPNEGGGGTSVIKSTIILPVACPVAFYGCLPAPQQRYLDNNTKLPINFPPVSPASTFFSYGYFAAKSMGLIKIPGQTYKPTRAYIPSEDKETILELRFATSDPPVPNGVTGSWSKIIEYPFGLGALYELDGKREPELTGTEFYADSVTKTVPLYRRRLKTKSRNGMVSVATCIPNDNTRSTAGWAELEYEESEREIIEIPPMPVPDDWEFVKYNNNGTIDIKKEFTDPSDSALKEVKTLTLNRQYLSENTGNYQFESCDTKTGICTYTYDPLTEAYDPYVDFPFWYGLTQPHRWSLTSNKNAAQLDYPACICNNLDRNEWLIPGQEVPYQRNTISLKYETKTTGKNNEPQFSSVSFSYYVAEAPESYSVAFSGTPRMTVYQFQKGDKVKYGNATSDVDYYLNLYETLNTVPPDGFPYPKAGALFITIINDSIVIEQPFGVFHDCENVSLVGLFLQADIDNIMYPMTARLDYVPYGYAIETQTPSCFYKVTAEENCAPRLVGVRYDVIRQDRLLYIRGACYKPCSTLTKM